MEGEYYCTKCEKFHNNGYRKHIKFRGQPPEKELKFDPTINIVEEEPLNGYGFLPIAKRKPMMNPNDQIIQRLNTIISQLDLIIKAMP